jgi:hypothetical protein
LLDPVVQDVTDQQRVAGRPLADPLDERAELSRAAGEHARQHRSELADAERLEPQLAGGVAGHERATQVGERVLALVVAARLDRGDHQDRPIDAAAEHAQQLAAAWVEALHVVEQHHDRAALGQRREESPQPDVHASLDLARTQRGLARGHALAGKQLAQRRDQIEGDVEQRAEPLAQVLTQLAAPRVAAAGELLDHHAERVDEAAIGPAALVGVEAARRQDHAAAERGRERAQQRRLAEPRVAEQEDRPRLTALAHGRELLLELREHGGAPVEASRHAQRGRKVALAERKAELELTLAQRRDDAAEIVGEPGRRLITLVGLLLEQPHDEGREQRRNRRAQLVGWPGPADQLRARQLARGVGREGPAPGQQLVERDADRMEVAACVGLARRATELLGREVGQQRVDVVELVRERDADPEHAGDARIGERDRAGLRLDEDRGRPQIAVHHDLRVQLLDDRAQLRGDGQDLADRDRVAAAALVQRHAMRSLAEHDHDLADLLDRADARDAGQREVAEALELLHDAQAQHRVVELAHARDEELAVTLARDLVGAQRRARPQRPRDHVAGQRKAHHVPRPATGSSRWKQLPTPSSLSTRSSPPCSCAMPWLTARPRPVPCSLRLVVKKGSKMRARLAAGMPPPRSSTLSRTHARASRLNASARSSMRLCSPNSSFQRSLRASRALVTRFMMTCWICWVRHRSAGRPSAIFTSSWI